MEKRKRLIVAAAAYNWAEAHRMAEIGKEFLKRGWEVFSLGSGRYDYLLKDKMEHLNLEEDSGWYTDERIKKLMDMDKWGNDYCREEELEEMTAAEVRLMEKIRPDLVITGYRTTLFFHAEYTVSLWYGFFQRWFLLFTTNTAWQPCRRECP